MYDQAAKMNAQMAVAGLVQGGLVGANASMPPQQTVSGEILARLETIHARLRNIADNQRTLLERLHGPRPTAVQSDSKSPIPSGLLQTIDERLNWLGNIVSEITENQSQLDRLA